MYKMSDTTMLDGQMRDLLYSLILLKRYCESLHDSEEFEVIKFAVYNVTKLADKICCELSAKE